MSQSLPSIGTPSVLDNAINRFSDICMQTLRWRPIAGGGIPHTLDQDDWYEGYFFPKGTMFFANAWSIHRTSDFADHEEFIPERWLGNKFGIKSSAGGEEEEAVDEKRRVLYGFGAGRRVCSGQRLAENSMVRSIYFFFSVQHAGVLKVIC